MGFTNLVQKLLSEVSPSHLTATPFLQLLRPNTLESSLMSLINYTSILTLILHLPICLKVTTSQHTSHCYSDPTTSITGLNCPMAPKVSLLLSIVYSEARVTAWKPWFRWYTSLLRIPLPWLPISLMLKFKVLTRCTSATRSLLSRYSPLPDTDVPHRYDFFCPRPAPRPLSSNTRPHPSAPRPLDSMILLLEMSPLPHLQGLFFLKVFAPIITFSLRP